MPDMQSTLESPITLTCCAFSVLLGLVGCASSSEADPVFGGEGASINAQQTPLDQAAPEEDTGPCAQASPASDLKLVEDFEDADNQLFKGFEREGWWYVAVDETNGQVSPTVGDFKATALPEGEATLENKYALYGTAQGFKDWGVVWGTTMRWVNDGLECPFNASKFVGLKLRAKGKGELVLKIGNPLTVPGEFEGKCKERCWDMHSKKIPLTDQWQTHVVRWDRVQQGGWGGQAKFDPERLLGLNFSVDGKDLPIEFWLDDIEFIVEGEQVAPAPTPAAPPPATTTGREPVAPPAAGTTPNAAAAPTVPQPVTPAPSVPPPPATVAPTAPPPSK